MTWRERIAEARERGRFSEEDFIQWMRLMTCPVGEQLAGAGLCENSPGAWKLYWLGTDDFYEAMMARDFAAADRVLDRIEDGVLDLKRRAKP